MKKNEKPEPSFFKWIRAARAEIGRDTEGMTAEEHVAYIHAKANASRLQRTTGIAPNAPAKSRAKIKAEVVGNA